jgi:hypothetical protein
MVVYFFWGGIVKSGTNAQLRLNCVWIFVAFFLSQYFPPERYPEMSRHIPVVVWVVAGADFAISTISMFVCSLMDPGIVPRNDLKLPTSEANSKAHEKQSHNLLNQCKAFIY